jgi:hypothetical protein
MSEPAWFAKSDDDGSSQRDVREKLHQCARLAESLLTSSYGASSAASDGLTRAATSVPAAWCSLLRNSPVW